MQRCLSGLTVAAAMAVLAAVTVAAVTFAAAGHAFAAPHNPFAVAGNEGGAAPCGMFGWLLAPEIYFNKLINGTVRAVKTNGSAVWILIAVSTAYGVLHAAGPGHGKAVVAAYMVANEQALRRGLVISLLAALFQGLVAVVLVAAAAFVFTVPMTRTTSAAEVLEIASYCVVALLGAWLVWRKGRGLLTALRTFRAAQGAAETSPHRHGIEAPRASVGAAAVGDRMSGSRQHVHADHGDHVHHADHVHDEHCGHVHAPDPRRLGDGFSWGSAALTVFAAGARPCSGAVFVLVFALAQGMFLVGVTAVVAMSLGTAVTTGILAAAAVLSKNFAVGFLGRGSARGALAGRAIEFAAALSVLLVGVGLLLGTWSAAACR